jgi:hypothetical protein
MIWVDGDAVYGTDRNTGWFVVMPHALSAKLGVDFIDVLPKFNGLIWAFRLTHITIYAAVID